jgi:hypothetical protein
MWYSILLGSVLSYEENKLYEDGPKVLLTNIIIGCTGLPGTNTLAYLPGVIFTTLHFVRNLRIGPISQSVCCWQTLVA